MVVVSVAAALLFNEIVVDAQHESGTGQTLACREPSPFWDNFERCKGEEEHLFWVAGLTAIVGAGTAALAHRGLSQGTAQRRGSRSTWIVAAGLAAFAGIVLWAFLYEINALPPEFH